MKTRVYVRFADFSKREEHDFLKIAEIPFAPYKDMEFGLLVGDIERMFRVLNCRWSEKQKVLIITTHLVTADGPLIKTLNDDPNWKPVERLSLPLS